MIPQVSGTCYLNACLNGFLQTPSTFVIFRMYLDVYKRHLTRQKNQELLSEFENVNAEEGSFCPPKSLISRIADTQSTGARFSGARFVLMKAIKFYVSKYSVFREKGFDIPNTIASYILQTTKVPLKDVKTQGGNSIDVAKAILKSIYGSIYTKKVQIVHEHQLSQPISESTQILIVLPGMKGDEHLFGKQWDSWYWGCYPDEILDFSAALFASSTKLYRKEELKEGERTGILNIESNVKYVVRKVLIILSNLLKNWKTTSTRKRKRESNAEFAVTFDDSNEAIRLLSEFRKNNYIEYQHFNLSVHHDEVFRALLSKFRTYLSHNKNEVEAIKNTLRRGYDVMHRSYVIQQLQGFEVGHAILSYTPYENELIGHAVAGIICDNKPFIFDSNNYVYPSDWRSSKTLQLRNYDTDTLEKCTKANYCGVDYVCYVRKSPNVSDAKDSGKLSSIQAKAQTETIADTRAKSETETRVETEVEPGVKPGTETIGGMKRPWYSGRTVGEQYGKNKRLLQAVMKGREDKRWAGFVEKAINNKIPTRLKTTIKPFHGSDEQVALLTTLISACKLK